MVVTRYVFIHRLADDRYLLINSLSGAVDMVEEQVVSAFAAIRQGASHELPADTVEALSQRGYLYPSLQDEEGTVARVVDLNQRHRAKNSPLCFVLCPTLSCNLRCPYCFEPHKMHEEGRLMTSEQVDRAFFALDRIREMRPDMPRATINLFGGEPLLPSTRRVVAQILAAAVERDLSISITSNGTHANHFIEILRPYQDRILFDISMDGVKEIHDKRRLTVKGTGTFDQISDNLDLLLAAQFRVAVRMNLNERNVDTVPRFMEYVQKRGWHRYENFQLNVSPVTNYTGNGGDGLISPSEVELRLQRGVPQDLLREVPLTLSGDVSRLTLPLSALLGETMVPGKFMPSLYYCEASGALFYCMGPDGMIYPCNQIIGDPTWAIGTYSPEFQIDADKAAIWQGRASTNMPKCRECSIAFLCSGGCPVMAKRTTGSPLDSYCGTSKEELAAYVDAMAPRLLALGGKALPVVLEKE